jgi:hypothetical protein
MNPPWLAFPWAARVDWPTRLELLRYRVDSRLLTQYPGVWLLRPRSGALPVVAVLRAWSVEEAPGPGSEVAWVSCLVVTEGQEPRIERVPSGALLCAVDERASDPRFLGRPLPEGLLERSPSALESLGRSLSGMSAAPLPDLRPPPAPPPRAIGPTGQLSLFG